MSNNEIIILILSFTLSFAFAYWRLPQILDYIIEKSQKRGFFNGPWKTHLGVGRKETSKIEMAAIARVGLGGNSSDETIYWNVFTDSEGNDLNTSNHYEIIIRKPLPIDYENKGFWSITVYGEDKFLIPNSSKNYMLRHNHFQDLELPWTIKLAPGTDHRGFTIPLGERREKFSMAMRCYRPLDTMKTQEECLKIELPEIRRTGL